ncbi:hypothetical protein [Inquilinus limosus]|uniref:hypothetical protein n=1 Tax=Inquilinus limosus TaxID=171674 RepID=UPI0012DC4200|nr:hypothetical protein [Inquilinus limosus]
MMHFILTVLAVFSAGVVGSVVTTAVAAATHPAMVLIGVPITVVGMLGTVAAMTRD